VNSLRNRLSLALSLVLLVAAGLLALGLQDFPRRLVEDYVGSRLQHDADLLYARVLDAPDPDAAAQDAAGTAYQVPLSGHYFVIHRGEQVIRSRSLWDEDLRVELPASVAEMAQRVPGPAGQSLLVFVKRFGGEDGGIVVAVTEDVGGVDAAIARFRKRLLIGVALALLALLALQRRLLVRGLAPLDKAVAACRRIERGELAAPDIDASARTAPSEVRPMLEALSRLARHQAQRLGRIRHAAGNLSHALKTPLAVLSQAADDVSSQGQTATAATIRAQLDSMRATIERELHRARLAGSGAPGESFEARSQLEALAAALQRLHRERHVSIEIDAPECRFPLDREDMLELFGNLLDNACKWARSRVRLSIPSTGEVADVLAFTVDDDGPGAPDEVRDRLGTAGLRTDEQQPGHGLGLAIVGDIVAQYGGTIGYRRSGSLGGLRVDVKLPMPCDAGADRTPADQRTEPARIRSASSSSTCGNSR